MIKHYDQYVLMFQELGLTRIEGGLLYCLIMKSPAKTEEIRQISTLQQPEISVSASRLLKRGWIEELPGRTDKKGRPEKVYKLNNFNSILHELRDEAQMEYGKKEKIINELEELCQKK